MQRINIKGKKIIVAKCLTCGHEVDVTDLIKYSINGLDRFNPLMAIDATATCCGKPDYYYDELWFKIR